jgi:hypothetical protein
LATRPFCILDDPNAIDHERAQGKAARAPGWTLLVETRPLLVFACCAMLFHFANAPLLPLVGQKLASLSQHYLHSARFRRGAPCNPDWKGTSNANQPARQNGYR